MAVSIASSGSALAQGEPTPTEPAQTEPAPSTPAPTTESEEMCDPPGCPETTTGQQPQATTEQQPQATEPPPAMAEPQPMPEPAPMPEQSPTPEQYEASTSVSWIDSVGLGFSVGGGVDDFAGDTMRGTTNVGGGWNVRATLGTKSYVAFEGSYIGSAQSIDALGLNRDAILVGNGAQGALRVNFIKDLPVQPFAYGGLAWRHYDVTSTNVNTSDISDSDDVVELPAGVGFSGYIAGFMADVRGEYRFASDEDLAPSQNTSGDAATLDRWGITANLGFAY